MSRRFYCDRIGEAGGAVLEGSEAHHLANVMRLGVGDSVVLFDGSGREFIGTVRRLSKARVELDVQRGQEVDRELPFSLVLGVALPKGERQKWLVEKAVELGVTRMVPLKTERGVADPASALTRLRRAVIEASKQCGRNRLMVIDDVASAAAFFEGAAGDAVRIIGQPGSDSPAAGEVIAPSRGRDALRYVAVGPEGGFGPAEFAAATSAGWQPVSLGPRVLRVETAAIALAAMFAGWQNDSHRQEIHQPNRSSSHGSP
jgi:16S rRNA (uracil1498-N3)-methyltransferase